MSVNTISGRYDSYTHWACSHYENNIADLLSILVSALTQINVFFLVDLKGSCLSCQQVDRKTSQEPAVSHLAGC